MNLEEYIEGFEKADKVELIPLTEVEQIHLFTVVKMFERDPLFKDIVGLLLRVYNKIAITSNNSAGQELVRNLLRIYDDLFKEV